MVKIFPIRFTVDNNIEIERVWKWVNEKVQNTKITQITPLAIESHQEKNLIKIKGLLETHCTENISTSEFARILQPYPDFIKHIYFTFQ